MSGIAAMRKAQAFVEEALRCSICGKLRTERVTEWRTRGTGRGGESVSTALRFQKRTDETHCTCPPAADPSVRSIPYGQPITPRTTPCDGCPEPAVGLVTCDNRLAVGGGSFRSFRCDHCAAKVIAQFDGIGFTAKLERFVESVR